MRNLPLRQAIAAAGSLAASALNMTSAALPILLSLHAPELNPVETMRQRLHARRKPRTITSECGIEPISASAQ